MNDWITPLRDFQRTGAVSDDLTPPLRLAWKFKAEGYIWSSPVIRRSRVYFPSPRPRKGLYALDLNSGEVIWNADEFEMGGIGSATVVDELLFICGNGALYIFDSLTGNLKERVPSNTSHSTPCVVNNIVYWGELSGSAVAYDFVKSEVIWKYDIGHPTKIIPTAFGDKIYFSNVKSVFSLGASSGDLVWERRFTGKYAVAHEPVTIGGDKLLVSFTTLGVYALDLETGDILWNTKAGWSTPISYSVDDGVAYVAGNSLSALSGTTGHEIWVSEKFAFNQSAPIAVGDHIFIGGGDWRYVYGFNRTSGQMIWNHPTGDLVYSTPAFADGKLLIGSHDGYLYCFERDF